MSVAAPARPAAAPAARPRPGVLVAVLWIGAAAISGFTALRYLDPFDEGLLLQAAARVLDGQWPYADFGWAYGPGHPLAMAAAEWAFGPSVLWWRIARVAADATIAVLAWRLARPAGPRWALAAWLATATIVAQPTSANPFTIALAFGLAAVAVAGGDGRTAPAAAAGDGRAAPAARAVLAGLLAALAVAWRPDLGAVAVVAVAATFAARRGIRAAAIAAGVAVAASALVYLPFAVAAGPGRLWDAVVVAAARDGSWWRLPFPLDYDGGLGSLADAKDVLGFYQPLIALLALAGAGAVLLARRRASDPAAIGLAVLALGAAVYFRSRADDVHAQPLLVCAVALLALAAATRPPRAVVAALAAGLALLLAGGAANRLSALLNPPELEAVRLKGVPGIRVPPREARALPALARDVQRRVPAGEAIYLAPRRSDLVTLSAPLVHFLVDRPNVLHRDVLLQARPGEQEAIVAALERARPRVVVRWTSPVSARPEPNRRGRSSGSRALDEFLTGAYRPAGAHGDYRVLVRR